MYSITRRSLDKDNLDFEYGNSGCGCRFTGPYYPMNGDSPSTSPEIVTGLDLHQKVIVERVLRSVRTVWIATANLKDMHIAGTRGYRPILQAFDQMAKRGVRFRVIHAELPSKPFRNTLEKCDSLVAGGLELQICPRSHWKMVIVDGEFAYLGSANFTGAGLGAKKMSRRNLELGVITENSIWVRSLEDLFDNFWIGENCRDCALSKKCPDPIIS